MKKINHAIITGAGSGLGHGMALRLLNRGSKVTVIDLSINDERRLQLDEAARRGGARWQLMPADIRDERLVRETVAEAVETFGSPDLAINSAGIGLSRAFGNMTSEEFRRVMEINLFGSYHFSAAVLPHLKPGARLALVASLAGITSNYSYAAYGTSKFGVVGLATTLRYEYEPQGINISCICPPEVKTPLVTEERASGDPVAMDLKLIAGSMELDPACDQIIAGLIAGQWLIIPSLPGKITAFVAQRMPGVWYGFMGSMIRKYMRRHGRVVTA